MYLTKKSSCAWSKYTIRKLIQRATFRHKKSSSWDEANQSYSIFFSKTTRNSYIPPVCTTDFSILSQYMIVASLLNHLQYPILFKSSIRNLALKIAKLDHASSLTDLCSAEKLQSRCGEPPGRGCYWPAIPGNIHRWFLCGFWFII